MNYFSCLRLQYDLLILLFLSYIIPSSFEECSLLRSNMLFWWDYQVNSDPEGHTDGQINQAKLNKSISFS